MRRCNLTQFRQLYFGESGKKNHLAVLYDAIIIGGGITGAGVALDLSSRGLKTLLLEKGDFASGTSSKSTKLVHGGLRYLQNLQFGVTMESVRERQLLLRLAPHLVQELDFVIPLYKSERLKNLKLKCGLWLYDWMAGRRFQSFHRRVSASEVRRRCPGIDRQNLTGGLVYSDCRTDDARHTLEVLKTACDYGAVALNYAEVSNVDYMENGSHAVDVVNALEPGDGKPLRFRGRIVINATGVWSKQTADMAGGPFQSGVVPAKGVHITLSPSRLLLDCAILLPSPHDDRFCFAVPWYESIIVGTTDTAYDGDFDDVRVLDEEVQYCLDAVNLMFPAANVTPKDVTGKYAGLRPLVSPSSQNKPTAALSRGHHLSQSDDGLITITGGKLTTYRVMAEETGDLVVQELLKRERYRKIRPGQTSCIMLSGWNYTEPDYPLLVACNKNVAKSMGLSDSQADYLHTIYGGRLQSVLAMTHQDQHLRLRIHRDYDYIWVQVVYAVRCESALTIDDVLSRRMRLTIINEEAAYQCSDSVSALMALELNWTEQQRAEELIAFKRKLHQSHV